MVGFDDAVIGGEIKKSSKMLEENILKGWREFSVALVPTFVGCGLLSGSLN